MEQPAPPEAPPRKRLRRWVLPGVLAGSVGIVALLGGFDDGGTVREFRSTETVDLGPMNVTIHEARAKRDEFDGSWHVRVSGECQVTTPEGLSLRDRVAWLSAVGVKAPPKQVGEPLDVVLGPEDFSGPSRFHLSGGLPPMPCAFDSGVDGAADLSEGIRFALSSMDWRDPSILQSMGEEWTAGDIIHLTELDVTVVEEF